MIKATGLGAFSGLLIVLLAAMPNAGAENTQETKRFDLALGACRQSGGDPDDHHCLGSQGTILVTHGGVRFQSNGRVPRAVQVDDDYSSITHFTVCQDRDQNGICCGPMEPDLCVDACNVRDLSNEPFTADLVTFVFVHNYSRPHDHPGCAGQFPLGLFPLIVRTRGSVTMTLGPAPP